MSNSSASDSRQTHYTCGGCDNTWTPLSAAHCAACHNTLSGVTTFDLHRSNGKCKPLPGKTGLRKDLRGIWTTAEDDGAFVARLERLAEARRKKS